MNFRRNLRIEAPPDIVWRILTDENLRKKWVPQLIDIVHDTPGDTGVGSWSTSRMMEAGKITTYRCQVTEIIPGTKISRREIGSSFDDKLEIRETWLLTPIASDTEVACIISIDLSPYGIMIPLMGLFIWIIVRGNLKKLLGTLAVLAVEELQNR